MNTHRLATIVIFLLLTLRIHGEFYTRLFDSHEIVSKEYRGISRDKDGYLWIGTNSGLLRFDGNNFDKYICDEADETSLSDNRIIKVMSDSQGRLWVGTCEGLNLFNPDLDTFTRISIPDENIYGYISDFTELSNGDIVFEASGVGLYIIKHDSDGTQAVQFPQGKEIYKKVTSLSETEDGTLIGGTHTGELLALLGPHKGKSVKLSDSSIRILISDRKGKVFAANADGAWIWDPRSGALEKMTLPPYVMPLEQSVVMTKDGNILIGTLNHGVMKLNPESKTVTPVNSLPDPRIHSSSTSISSIYEDASGDIWLGCSNKGILLVSRRKTPVQYLNMESIQPEHYGGVSHIAKSNKSENIFIGYSNGKLLEVTPNGSFVHEIQLLSGIGCMMSSKNGNIYIGLDNLGLYEFNPDTRVARLVHGIDGFYSASCIAEDLNGNIYLGILGSGIKKINPLSGKGEWIKNERDGFDPIWPAALYCDKDNNLWLGLYSALWLYNATNGIFSSISGKHPAMVKGVHNSFAEDKDGRIWDASSNGLFIIDPKTNEYVRLTPKEGLSDIYVSSIVADKDGYMWAGCNNAIDRIDKGLNITHFKSNTIDSDNGYTSGVWDSVGQNVMFAGIKGMTSINTDVANSKKDAHPIRVSSIYLNGKKINAESRNADGKTVMGDNKGDGIRLYVSDDDNTLEVHVTPLDYYYPDNIRYEWRIKGISDDWNQGDIQPGVIRLPHLPSGSHLLEIRSAENGIYSDTVFIKISVSSPWYLSTFMKIIYVLMIIGIFLLIWKMMRHRQNEHINDERIKFFMNISHEIRSPLTLILGPIEKMMKKNNDPDTSRQLSLMHRNASRILALTNQLLDMRKIEKGKMKLDLHDVELKSFVRDLVEVFQDQAKEKGINLTFDDSEESDVHVRIDANNFDKVLVNLISNALKYTKEGDIDVKVGNATDQNGTVWAEITVSDTGIGLDPKMIDHLFDRFYQGKEQNRSNMGFGIGLDLCRMLVELHGGTITAQNREDGHGSIFTVKIPASDRPATDDSEKISSEERSKSLIAMPVYLGNSQEAQRASLRNNAIRILVADDDKEMRDYIYEAFRNSASIMMAADGREAVRLLHEHRFDLIITDVVMPDMDGIELLRTIRAYAETSHLPVIMLSSLNDVADRVKGWDTGADAYLGKPFSIDELRAVADNLIEGRQRLRGKFSGASDLDGKVETPELKGNDDGFMAKVTDTINNHLGDSELNVEKLCDEIGISRTHLNRKMKEMFGSSPSELIRSIRMKKACELLENPDIDVSQIAYSIGYSSLAHFSTSFKKSTGVSPSEFRMRHKDKL